MNNSELENMDYRVVVFFSQISLHHVGVWPFRMYLFLYRERKERVDKVLMAYLDPL